jgi:hypothetical protein
MTAALELYIQSFSMLTEQQPMSQLGESIQPLLLNLLGKPILPLLLSLLGKPIPLLLLSLLGKLI